MSIAMAVGNFNGGLSEVRSEMSDIESQLTTILTALSSGLRNRNQVIKESDDTSDSGNDNPAKYPRRKAKKQKQKPGASSTKFSKGNKFLIRMQFDHSWDEKTKNAYNAVKTVYAKDNPSFSNKEKDKPRKKLQRELDKLDEE